MGGIMKKAIVIVLVCLGLLALVVVMLPRLTSKETLTYEEAAERFAQGEFVSVDGKKVHYIERGVGDPDILIHGFLYHTMMWERNWDALAEHFKVLCYRSFRLGI